MGSPAVRDLIGAPRALFTAPWDALTTRRGDALGLRAFTDVLSDAVAPDLNNRINDARWVTILSWCLVRSHDAHLKSDGPSMMTREGQRSRYAWLQPLELMWVRRTITIAENEGRLRQLPGQRSIRASMHGRDDRRFGMSDDQRLGYRQNGAYGAYRLGFRMWPRMTRDRDGFTPDAACVRLAEWMDQRLGPARVDTSTTAFDGGVTTRSARIGLKDRDRWWENQWRSYCASPPNVDRLTLPRPYDEMEQLPEASLLRPAIFGTDPNGERRERIVNFLASSTAQEHGELCHQLAEIFPKDRAIATVGPFSTMADAAMEVMHIVLAEVAKVSALPLFEIAKRANSESACSALFDAVQVWRRSAIPELRHVDSAHRFANVIRSPDPLACVRAVVQHHQSVGTGVQWFAIRNDVITPRSFTATESAGYRFRLAPLCRLAVQTGVISAVPPALFNVIDDADAIQGDEESAQ